MSEQPSRRLELPEGQWAEVVDFGSWTQRRFDTFREIVRALKNGNADAEAEEKFLRISVDSWHLIDPDDGKVMNDPKTDDLRSLTVDITRQITERIVEVSTSAATPFPKMPTRQ